MLADVRIDRTLLTVVHVRWTPPFGGESWVEYGPDGVLDLSTPSVHWEGATHEVHLLGLKAGREYRLEAYTRSPDGEV